MKPNALILWILAVALLLCGCSQGEPEIQKHETYFTMNQELSLAPEAELELKQSGTVTVTFVSTEGPTEFQVNVLYKARDAEAYTLQSSFPLTLGETSSVQLPAGVVYKITATATAGQQGNAAFEVTVE